MQRMLTSNFEYFHIMPTEQTSSQGKQSYTARVKFTPQTKKDKMDFSLLLDEQIRALVPAMH